MFSRRDIDAGKSQGRGWQGRSSESREVVGNSESSWGSSVNGRWVRNRRRGKANGGDGMV